MIYLLHFPFHSSAERGLPFNAFLASLARSLIRVVLFLFGLERERRGQLKEAPSLLYSTLLSSPLLPPLRVHRCLTTGQARRGGPTFAATTRSPTATGKPTDRRRIDGIQLALNSTASRSTTRLTRTRSNARAIPRYPFPLAATEFIIKVNYEIYGLGQQGEGSEASERTLIFTREG